MRKIKFFVPLILIGGFWISSCDREDAAKPGALVPLTVDENSFLPSISVNGTLLHSETFGNPDNTMLVMLHGGPGGDYRDMLKNKAFADAGYFVVFYDQRGSGLSQRHNAEVFTVQMFIDDLNAVIEYYRADPAQKIVLVGHSWGAMLAAGYVNRYPEKIAGLILTEPGGFTWETASKYIGRARKLELFAEGTNDFVYLDQFFTGSDHRTLDYKAALESIADQHVGNTGILPFWRKGAICSDASFRYVQTHSFDFTTNLNAYSTKVFFGYSELNKAYRKAHAELVSSAFRNVELVEFKDTGHDIPFYGWNDYYITALNYLNEIL